MPVQRPRPHGGAEFQRALEGDKLHFQPLFGEQAFVRRDVQDDGVGGGEDAEFERGAVCGLEGGKDEQGKDNYQAAHHVKFRWVKSEVPAYSQWKRLCYRKWLVLFSLKFQRNSQQSTLTIDSTKGKTGKKAVFYRAVEMKQPHTI